VPRRSSSGVTYTANWPPGILRWCRHGCKCIHKLDWRGWFHRQLNQFFHNVGVLQPRRQFLPLYIGGGGCWGNCSEACRPSSGGGGACAKRQKQLVRFSLFCFIFKSGLLDKRLGIDAI
jgi:hypothetical protein